MIWMMREQESERARDGGRGRRPEAKTNGDTNKHGYRDKTIRVQVCFTTYNT